MPPPESQPSNLQSPTAQTASSSPPSLVFNLDLDMEESKPESPPKTEPTKTPPNPPEIKHPINLLDPSDDEHRPPSHQPTPPLPGEAKAESEQEKDEEMPLDPAEEIQEFDWNHLHEQYHLAMTTASAQEAAILQEFAHLMDYFKIWADAGANQESDRTFHRLRTRMTYTQNSEQRLEKTRQHYVEVVRAFESALALLRNAGFGG